MVARHSVLAHVDLSDNGLKEKFASAAFQRATQSRNILSLKLQGNYISLKKLRDIDGMLERNRASKRRENVPKYQRELVRLETVSEKCKSTENMLRKVADECEKEKKSLEWQEEKFKALESTDVTRIKVAQERTEVLKKRDLKLNNEMEVVNIEHREEESKYTQMIQNIMMKLNFTSNLIKRLQLECTH